MFAAAPMIGQSEAGMIEPYAWPESAVLQ